MNYFIVYYFSHLFLIFLTNFSIFLNRSYQPFRPRHQLSLQRWFSFKPRWSIDGCSCYHLSLDYKTSLGSHIRWLVLFRISAEVLLNILWISWMLMLAGVVNLGPKANSRNNCFVLGSSLSGFLQCNRRLDNKKTEPLILTKYIWKNI